VITGDRSFNRKDRGEAEVAKGEDRRAARRSAIYYRKPSLPQTNE
jgi:hypothetical protein